MTIALPRFHPLSPLLLLFLFLLFLLNLACSREGGEGREGEPRFSLASWHDVLEARLVFLLPLFLASLPKKPLWCNGREGRGAMIEHSTKLNLPTIFGPEEDKYTLYSTIFFADKHIINIYAYILYYYVPHDIITW